MADKKMKESGFKQSVLYGYLKRSGHFKCGFTNLTKKYVDFIKSTDFTSWFCKIDFSECRFCKINYLTN